MIKKIIYFLVVFLTFAWLNHNYIYADVEERQNDYKELVDINIWTFNEYWYKITELFFTLTPIVAPTSGSTKPMLA